MASTDAKPVAVKNQAYRATFPIFDADGDLVSGATGLDSEVSKDAGTFTDCTNEATEIASSSGMYYLDLTSTEMNADTVAIIVKTTSSGAKTTPLTIYPTVRGLADLAFPNTSGRGMDVDASGGVEVGSLQAGAITSAAFAAGAIDAAAIAASAIGSSELAAGAITSATFAAGAINAAAIATDAIDADAMAANAIDSAVLAAGAITAATIATDAIDSDAIAASAVTEIQAGLGTSANQATILANIALIQADTDNLQTRVPAALVGGRMDSDVGAMSANVMTAAATAADYVTELSAAAAAATSALTSVELAAIPGVGATLEQKVTYIYEQLRHKITQTGAVQTIFKDDGVTVLGTSAVSDAAGVFTRGEFV